MFYIFINKTCLILCSHRPDALPGAVGHATEQIGRAENHHYVPNQDAKEHSKSQSKLQGRQICLGDHHPCDRRQSQQPTALPDGMQRLKLNEAAESMKHGVIVAGNLREVTPGNWRERLDLQQACLD